MSRRETRSKPEIFTAVGGVNQRVYDTELKREEYSLLEGVFPELAGLQGRLYGKRLLSKYASSVYSIFQFWTPLGYGSGLFQFTGDLRIGPWITPISKFDLDLDDLKWDENYFTVDEFGNPPGHDYPGIDQIPNDVNGGPVGQGASCGWELVGTPIAIGKSNFTFGDDGEVVDNIEGIDPHPLPLTAFPQYPSPIMNGQGSYGGHLVAYRSADSEKFNLGGGNWRAVQSWRSYTQKAVLDFSEAQPLPSDPPPLFIKLTFAIHPNAPFEYYDAVVPVTFDTYNEHTGIVQEGNFRAFPFDPWGYIINDNPALNGNNGFSYSSFIDMIGATEYRMQLHCPPN